MFYKTRVMVAAEDFLHGADLLRKGNTFVATEIDAEYLQRKGRASFAPEAQPAAKVEPPAPAPAAPAPAPAEAPAPVADKPIETPEGPVPTEASEQQPADAAPAGEPVAESKAELAPVAPLAPARRGGRRPANSTTSE
ncbi:hypothetical protein [Variovorax sp. JS1663]|uniref:hypothetical protein n=1 Tax=Variovorax sp. JS1663 TaxID=1851577 RepID=UPI000B345B23|nr:hypothetical protein [Variovorax sp. JS1663]OUL98560.1 hypothetical protein A8M77_31050 [Variovorax sp. JS1663]